MKVVICDPDNIFCDQIMCWLLTALFETDMEVKVINSFKALEQSLQNPPHLLITELNLPDGFPLESIAKQRASCPQMEIIYMTADAQGVDIAPLINTKPFGFLDKGKPADLVQSAFFEILERYMQQCQYNKFISYRAGGCVICLFHQDIIYFEKNERKVTPHTIHGIQPSFYKSMRELEQQLWGSYFLFISQSFAVNPIYVDRFHRDKLFLKNGERLSISRGHQKKVRSWVDRKLLLKT